jgi:RNA polymerase sigma factor (sigma-70 family)
MQHISKQRIIPLFNERDPDATEWVCRHYFAQVYVIASRLTVDGPEPDELAQQTFIKLLKVEKPFKDFRHLELVLFRIAKNLALDVRRHENRVREKAETIAAYYASLFNEEEAIKAAELSAAFHHLIQLGINILPARCKKFSCSAILQQMKNAEIARRLGITERPWPI